MIRLNVLDREGWKKIVRSACDRARRERIKKSPKLLARHRKKSAAYQRRRLRDPKKRAKHRAIARAWKNGPGKGQHLKNRFGIDETEYQRLHEKQGGLCAICGEPERTRDHRSATGVRRLAVDHDHETKEIRGLLCTACNRGIGWLGDDLARVEAAAKYLREALCASDS